jgi:ABC-type phosphonate transport system ATPase subunit
VNSADRYARKQVLLTRIAFQRNEMRRGFAQMRHATEPRQLLRALVGNSLGGTIGRALFGAGPAVAGDLIAQGLAWLRRYRVTAALVGSVIPALSSGGGRWRRVLRIGVIAGAAWLGWSVVRKREQPRP